MFSVEQKRQIAAAVEKALLDIGHPEMPKDRPSFNLHVDGAESWSWADIEPNWIYDEGKKPDVSLWNESVAEQMKKNEKSIEQRLTAIENKLDKIINKDRPVHLGPM
jgi:hypothetical protein